MHIIYSIIYMNLCCFMCTSLKITILTLVACLRTVLETRHYGSSMRVETGKPENHTEETQQEQAPPAHKEVVEVISEPWPGLLLAFIIIINVPFCLLLPPFPASPNSILCSIINCIFSAEESRPQARPHAFNRVGGIWRDPNNCSLHAADTHRHVWAEQVSQSPQGFIVQDEWLKCRLFPYIVSIWHSKGFHGKRRHYRTA